MTAAIEVRVCARAGCGAPLVRRESEGTTNWKARKFCSVVCADIRRGRKPTVVPPRTCAREGCTARLVRRQSPRENSEDWRARRFCSAECNHNRFTPAPPRQLVQVPKSVAEQVPVSEQKWMRFAACTGADPERFSPIEKFERTGRDRCRQAAAEFCRRCPVVGACHAFAQATDQQGVWAAQLRQVRGGKTSVEPLLGAPAEAAS